ncbi:translocation/assembly module TamB domain-containing protein [Methylobacillus flagellatus]|uniref:translocation/assembly module TamB domain-containing protein n=1 Tax=Methylobacillus flagellatus TaxID=405 RepID=UPI0014851E83|nr:translocation/assembly module TamB domain-containing protein [Methylobacillus flagellatus]
MLLRGGRGLCAALAVLLSLGLGYTVQAMNINVTTSLDSFSYQLGSLDLQLEKLETTMQLAPDDPGRLNIQKLHAQRLTIHIKDDQTAEAPAADKKLPDKITLPVLLEIQQADIREVIIVNGHDRQVLKAVQLTLKADPQQLSLQLGSAQTPWGDIVLDLGMQAHYPFALNGSLALKQNTASLDADLKLSLGGSLQQLQLNTDVYASRPAQALVLHANATGNDDEARLQLRGQLSLERDYPVSINADLSQISPALFGLQDSGRIDLTSTVQGHLLPSPAFTLNLRSQDSLWRGEPLQLNLQAALKDSLLRDLKLDASLAANHLHAAGSLGAAGDTLSWRAQLPELSRLGSAIGGKLSADGEIRGTMDQLLTEFKLQAEKLTLPGDLRIDTVTGSGRLGPAGLTAASSTPAPGKKSLAPVVSTASDTAPETALDPAKLTMDASLQLTGLRTLAYPKRVNADVKLQGTLDQHSLTAQARSVELELDALLQGGLLAQGGWQGQLQRFNYQEAGGAQTLQLKAPATLTISDPQGLQLGPLVMNVGQGALHLTQLSSGPQGLLSTGELRGIPLQVLPRRLLSLPANLDGDAVFSGQWQLVVDQQVNGLLQIKRDSGDIVLREQNQKPIPLGLQQLESTLRIDHNVVELQAAAQGTQLGNIQLQFESLLNTSTGNISLRRDAPLQARISADLNTLSWLGIVTDAVQMDGKLQIALQADGTIAHPHLRGTAAGQALQLALPDEGVSLKQGVLQLSLADDTLQIQQARFMGGEGTLEVAGKLQWQPGSPSLALDWKADRFTATSRTDRVVVVSGSLATALSDGKLQISGDLSADRGNLLLSDDDKPSLGKDVVVDDTDDTAAASPLDYVLSGLNVDLGGNFSIQGRGLDGKLGGKLRLTGSSQRGLRADGNVQASGTYMAYGQVLNIETGQITFTGPVDNPGLNIVATRQQQAVKVGVKITGTAVLPTVKLVSWPEMSDGDKLSWLILGHGISEAGQNDFALLSLAAGALLSQGQSVPLQTRFARAAGLDSFNIGGTNAQNTSLSLGKRLSSKLFLSYEKAFNGLLNVARLTYQLTDRWSVRSQAGSESAVDVLYTFSFR